MALLVSGCAVLVHEVKLADKPAALRHASAKATVPVLVLPDGTVIDESLDIMRWALHVRDPEDWLGVVDAALIERCDSGFKRDLDGYKYGRSIANRTDGLAFLDGLEVRLERMGGLCRDARGFTDAAIMPFVRQFAAVDRGWFDGQPLPGIQAWLAGLESSALFAAVMAQVPAEALQAQSRRA